ncbi:LAME_0B07624g1_1 [Lachancea meyersii CBS 8951]|uniref:LAME_0B07624g1_1 n=1 Tax=Lachancea meyersii CBS 8951 TaxID=1266667 RepID=A0A1G4IXE0_9SACH|nr:LAME_0B07624g1_1 [Lachancea meyersii CBS 8951]
MSDVQESNVISRQQITSTVNNTRRSLEERRKALLKSISDKKEKLRNDIVLTEKKEQVRDAIDDIIRLGYSFEKLRDESGISPRFLREAFESTGRVLAVPDSVTDEVQEKEAIASESEHTENTETPHSTPNPTSYSSKAPSTKRRKLAAERPVWLRDLVIDLTSSGDESDYEVQEKKPPVIEERTQRESDIINLGSEVSRIGMRLKIEISRLTQRIRATHQLPMNDELLAPLMDRKNSMLNDITTLFDEIISKKQP